MVFSELERKILSEVSREEAWRHVEWFTAAGEKLSGTPVNEKSVDYILKSLDGYGVKATAPEFQAWLDFPHLFDTELKVTAPFEKTIEAMALRVAAGL